MKCPTCQLGIMIPAVNDYRIGDSVINNTPVLRCDCGEIIVSDDNLKKMMDYINRPTHEKEVEWSELG